MGFYDPFVQLALDAIAEAGLSVTLREVVDAEPLDANKPWLVDTHDPMDDTTYTVNAVMTELPKEQQDGNGSLVRGDKFLLVPQFQGTPAIGWLVEIGEETWEVINPLPVNPGGVVVLWKLVIRRWPQRMPKPPMTSSPV